MLPVKPVSAIDCVNPAIEWTKRAMFRPFRWAKWWRIGLVAAAIGEMSSFSCNFNSGNWGEIMRKQPDQHFQAAASTPFPPGFFGPVFAVLFVGIIVLVFVHMYVASVLRFVYFDAVATGRFRLREGWSRWHSHGLRWFGFSLLLSLIVITAFVVIAVPVALVGVGIYKAMGGVGIAILALIGIPLGLVLLLVLAAFGVMVKDFAIPVMALQEVSAFTAFKHVIKMAWARKGEHAGYVGIKIVLAIAFSIAAAIVEVILFFIVLTPIIGAMIAGGIFGAAGGGFDPQKILGNPALIAAIFLVIVLTVFFVMAIAAIVLAPALFFFEAYVLTWYAQRFEPLWDLLYPPAPEVPAAKPVIAPTEPPPPLPAV
jgi:hypothetical protein